MDTYTPRLLDVYKTEIKNNLKGKLAIKNIMQVPKLNKIVLNMGIGDGKDNKTSMKQALDEMTKISGQKPVVTKSKKAISNFKIRIGDPVGISVTLRRNQMYEFLDRFISVTSPRIRDFSGFSSKGFDGNGNYNFGISEQIIFPEIDYDKVNSIRGMNITIVTTASNDYDSYQLLKNFGFPINEFGNKKNITDKSETKDVKSESTVEEIKEESAVSEETEIVEENKDVNDNEITSKEEK